MVVGTENFKDNNLKSSKKCNSARTLMDRTAPPK
jgi:hypothetical protein